MCPRYVLLHRLSFFDLLSWGLIWITQYSHAVRSHWVQRALWATVQCIVVQFGCWKTKLLSQKNIYKSQTREQMSVPDLYVLTVAFLALKKLVFVKKKILPKKKSFFLPFFYATFQCGHYNVFNFFAHKKLKKPPQKVAYLLSAFGRLFFSAAPTAQTSPELHFRFINSFIQSSLLRSLTFSFA